MSEIVNLGGGRVARQTTPQRLGPLGEGVVFPKNLSASVQDLIANGGRSKVFNGNTELSGVYNGGVVVKGDVTLVGDIEVNGDLTVLGSVSNNDGHAITIHGSFTIYGGKYDSFVKDVDVGDILVTGDLRVINAFLGVFLEGFFQIGMWQNALNLTVGGDFQMAAGFIGPNFQEFPDFPMTNVNGGLIKVHGDLVSTDPFGSFGASPIGEGNGFTIEVRGNCIGSVFTGGGFADPAFGGTGDGGYGGDLTIDGTVYRGDLAASGGGTVIDGRNGGDGGTIKFGGLVPNVELDGSSPDRELKQSIRSTGGGSSESATLSGGSGGKGSTILCGGDIHCEEIDISGGASFNGGDGGDAGILAVVGKTILSDKILGRGGDASFNAPGGTGGKGAELSLYGGLCGGEFRVDVDCQGGRGYFAGNKGGDGRQFIARGSIENAVIEIDGGLGSDGADGGRGGNYDVKGSVFNSQLITRGGNGDVGAAAGSGGNGGSINVLGPCFGGNFQSPGGIGYGTGNGGDGGFITMSDHVNDGNVESRGGNAQGTGTGGWFGNVALRKGAQLSNAIAKAGTGGTPTGSSRRLEISQGAYVINRIDAQDNTTLMEIKPNIVAVTLVVGEFLGLTRLVSDDGSNLTGNQAGLTQNSIYKYDPQTRRWQRFSGTVI